MPQDFSKLKLPELKEELKKRGLKVGGKKEELLKRLEEATNQEADSSDEEVEEPETKKRKVDSKSTGKEEKTTSEGSGWGDLVDYLTDDGWKDALKDEFNKPYFKGIIKFLQEKGGKEIFPPKKDVFNALNWTPLSNVKCVILGQDPYHDNNQAHGVCFSVRPGIPTPPSLRNMYQELEKDVPPFKAPSHGYLKAWALQGVLLLNATLTVEAHKANSHAKCGWLTFTDEIIKVLNAKREKVVFILWGGFAQKKGKIIDRKKHHVIEAAHPSPLSVTKFRGCKVFSKTNAYLTQNNIDPIDWNLPATVQEE